LAWEAEASVAGAWGVAAWVRAEGAATEAESIDRSVMQFVVRNRTARQGGAFFFE
jgi:hypothetical protein